MDSDQGKLFIGGISQETNEDKLKDYFQGYGEVVHAVVMIDRITGNSRGFGFVVFSDPEILDRVLQDTHVIHGRTVEAKRALSREEQQVSRVGNSGGTTYGNNTRTKKIFVGGLPPNLSENTFRSYFEPYGAVTDHVIMYDQHTSRPRGFGFITFDSEEAVDRVLHKTFHDMNGKQVEVKRALPKDSHNSTSFDGRMESGRYMHSQNSGSGYPSYPLMGYNAPGYGFGPAGNTMGYGYGNYGGSNPGYGNPNVAAYGGSLNAPRNSWGSQIAGGYRWASAGQSPGGASGYGNQGYGYGGYVGNEGAYGNQAAYGAVGGRGGNGPNGAAVEGGYGNGSSGDAGYGNPSWRSDGSQASGNYGGGLARQPQQ